jgi:hypothetical protein
VPKRAIPEGDIGPLGIAGDAYNHPEIHGGPRQAVLLIASEAIAEITALGYPLYPGALGENITTVGIDRKQWRRPALASGTSDRRAHQASRPVRNAERVRDGNPEGCLRRAGKDR